MTTWILAAFTIPAVAEAAYPDGRPTATLRTEARDHGVVLKEGSGYRMFFSAASQDRRGIHRTLGIARTGAPETWGAGNKAVVLDGRNCTWSRKCIGMPSVIQAGNRLAVFYDAPGGDSTSHMKRDIGLAWLDLPLSPPNKEENR